MSTEQPTPVPRTRAELRALRAAQRAAEPASSTQQSEPGPGARPSSRQTQEPAAAIPQTQEPAFAAVPQSELASSIPPASDDAAPGGAAPELAPPAADPARRRFWLALGSVLAVLLVVAAGLGAVSLFQGPRLSEVQVNPAEAIESSGSRVILTANQALSEIDESQVTVEPAVPFTLDAAGRNIGIRFTVPLDDDTDYTVRVDGVTGAGGGPAADLQTGFTTPAAEIFLLKRDVDADDAIFRTDLSGEQAIPVFTHPRINDYRATATRLVVAVEDEDGAKILVMDRDGENARELELPGDGFVSAVQVSDRGNLVGYVYSDRELTEDSGRASVLVTQSLAEGAEPHIIEVGGEEASVAEWQFVPDSAAVLFIDFTGTLSLDDRSGDAGPQSMGNAMTIQGISRGTYTAIVERTDGSIVELNLADGSETPLEASDPDFGPATTITPFPGGTLRHVVARDAAGLPTGQAIVRVDDDGAATSLIEVEGTDAILQACASPSGQYAGVVVAPELAENRYDDMLVPLPETVHTHLLDIETGEELVVLNGFDISWCHMAPSF